MNKNAVAYIIAYVETQNVSVQLSFVQRHWTAMFKHSNHAAVCFEEMKENGFDIKRTSLSNGELVKLY